MGEKGEPDGTPAVDEGVTLAIDRGAESKLLNALKPLLSVASGEYAETEGALGAATGDGKAFDPSSESGAGTKVLDPPALSES